MPKVQKRNTLLRNKRPPCVCLRHLPGEKKLGANNIITPYTDLLVYQNILLLGLQQKLKKHIHQNLPQNIFELRYFGAARSEATLIS
uniref:Uncharacterized protein n=1 Tax=uncultured alpha proteobacterium HF0130_20P23 TaxID=710809 RepID=E0XTA8_9PROT|nr:hypothetical protein [uncultured alpha proteobacterium HF0130_20P23]